MAATANWYAQAFDSAFRKKIDVGADTFKMMLVTSAYTFDGDAHNFKDDVSNEVSGTGYTAGGQALTTVALSYNSGTNTLKFDFDDPAWAGATIANARAGIVYDSTPGTDATRPLMIYFNFGADQPVAAGTLTVTLDAGGAATVTVA